MDWIITLVHGYSVVGCKQPCEWQIHASFSIVLTAFSTQLF